MKSINVTYAGVSPKFLKHREYDQRLVLKAREWHDKLTFGYKVKPVSENELVEMYLLMNEKDA